MDRRRRLYYLREVFVRNYYFDLLTARCPQRVITHLEDILDRIFSFLGSLGTWAAIYRRSETSETAQRSLYVVREYLTDDKAEV